MMTVPKDDSPSSARDLAQPLYGKGVAVSGSNLENLSGGLVIGMEGNGNKIKRITGIIPHEVYSNGRTRQRVFNPIEDASRTAEKETEGERTCGIVTGIAEKQNEGERIAEKQIEGESSNSHAMCSQITAPTDDFDEASMVCGCCGVIIGKFTNLLLCDQCDQWCHVHCIYHYGSKRCICRICAAQPS